MTLTGSGIIILIVIAFAIYLIYTQQSVPAYMMQPQQPPRQSCPPCNRDHGGQTQQPQQPQQMMQMPPQQVNIALDNQDPYSDAIKRQDLYTMNDPLTYPQMRLPREVLERYNDFYQKNGAYPPFNAATQPFLFDNPVLNGYLTKVVEEGDVPDQNTPSSVPLFRVKSVKNANRYFYFILDQRYLSKVELKIPLDNVKINGQRYTNADYYGVPEIFDGDVIEHINIFPDTKYKVTLYKTYNFP